MTLINEIRSKLVPSLADKSTFSTLRYVQAGRNEVTPHCLQLNLGCMSGKKIQTEGSLLENSLPKV